MFPTRLSAIAGAGLASLAACTPAPRTGSRGANSDAEVAELAARTETANAALLRGDVATYRRLVTVSDDFLLMSPFGGRPSPRGAPSDAAWDDIGRFFRNGTLRQEVAATYAVPDMVVLAVIEHAHGEVGGLPAQDWALRVTLVYRKDAGHWRLVHRHADPLARGITLQQSASLARAGGG